MRVVLNNHLVDSMFYNIFYVYYSSTCIPFITYCLQVLQLIYIEVLLLCDSDA